jgi:hypothetical protein
LKNEENIQHIQQPKIILLQSACQYKINTDGNNFLIIVNVILYSYHFNDKKANHKLLDQKESYKKWLEKIAGKNFHQAFFRRQEAKNKE